MRLRLVLIGLIAVAGLRLVPAGGAESEAPNQLPSDECTQLGNELNAYFQKTFLPFWFPRCVDQRGGFSQVFNRSTFEPAEDCKSLVYQARLTWLAAQTALKYPEHKKTYSEYARHGVKFLAEQMWDKTNGGFYWELDAAGRPTRQEKHVYGQAFAIYAAANTYRATGDEAALDLALKTFDWLEKHAHDDEHGGYFEALTPAGRPIRTAAEAPDAGQIKTCINALYGQKTMNAHIHLLEALTVLFETQKENAAVQSRLQELFMIVRDKIAAEDGYLRLYFAADWAPVPGQVSYGHDVETAFLLTEAEGPLRLKGDPRTRRLVRKLVDHAQSQGWDAEYGGLADQGHPDGTVTNYEKVWWVQAENLNALLLLQTKYYQQTTGYFRAAQVQWRFLKEHLLVDPAGGCLSVATREGQANPKTTVSSWHAGYHLGRMLINSSRLAWSLGNALRERETQLAACATPLASRRPLALRAAAPLKQPVAVYEKIELRLDLEATYDNPFDPEQLEVTAEFTAPDGRRVAIPGFFYREFEPGA